MTSQEIKAFAAKHNLRIEENYPQSYSRNLMTEGTRNELNAKTDYHYTIGIELHPYIWYWWKTFCHETPEQIEQDTLYFSERYSQRSGQCVKGFHAGFMAEMKMRNN